MKNMNIATFWTSVLSTLSLMAGSRSDDTSSPCSDGWVRVGENTCIQFNDKYQLQWDQANQYCLNQKASLLRFSDAHNLNEFAQEAVAHHSIDGWWSGINDLNHPNTWTWGSDMKATSDSLIWAQEPTDVHHVENCLAMDYDGAMSDDMCSRTFGFVCVYPQGKDNCTNHGFTSSLTGLCVYVSRLDDPTEMMSWQDAKSTCASRGIQLGLAVTLARFNATQYDSIQGLLMNMTPIGKRWIGLNDQKTEGEWSWDNFQTAKNTSYLRWRQYPERAQADCGLVHSSGKMEQDDCSIPYNFICWQSINLDDISTATKFSGCTAPWIRGGRKCYYLNGNVSVDNPTARAQCRSVGGDLIKVESAAEKVWLSLQTIRLRITNLWTGLRRASNNSQTWVWADGSPSNPAFYEWNQEPNNDNGNEDCAYLTTDNVYNDADCYLKTSFICELISEDAPCRSGWNASQGPDATTCYYVSNSARDGLATWAEAKVKCTQLAGLPEAHLLAVETQAEFDYVTSLIKGLPWAGYWTDLTDSDSEGTWTFATVYETYPPLIQWSKEPNNLGGHENCAVMYSRGRLNDVQCNSSAYVACERGVAEASAASRTQSIILGCISRLVTFLLIIKLLIIRTFVEQYM